ncbi:hypothetical protein EVAR_730_1 [Eumeta japonica]|uniref:Uncharacterized protein n=1 Tax=Eumeta variegata TaxID=151549 RepID=A0A4C1SCL0_EUMVA|nr:hypothetical protein EVAR_730_1 [Eumeta japonica]
MYGSKSWVCRRKNERMINAVEMCSMCGVSLKDRCRNSVVRERCGLKEDVVSRVEMGGTNQRPRTAVVVTVRLRIGGTKRKWRLCVKYAKCIVTFPRLKCMQLICTGGCAIYNLQRNWCIRRSCTPTTTCEARAAINKSNEHRNAIHHFAHTPQESVLRGECEGKSEVWAYATVLKSSLHNI